MKKIIDFFYFESLSEIFVYVTLSCWFLFMTGLTLLDWRLVSIRSSVGFLLLSMFFGFWTTLYANTYKKSRSFWDYARQIRRSVSDATKYSQIDVVKFDLERLEKLIGIPRHRKEFESIKMDTELKRRRILEKLKNQ